VSLLDEETLLLTASIGGAPQAAVYSP